MTGGASGVGKAGRRNDSEWVMRDGIETSVGDWNPAVDFAAVTAPDLSAL